MIDDHIWDLFAFAGHSPVLGAKVRSFGANNAQYRNASPTTRKQAICT